MKNRRANPNPIRPDDHMPVKWLELFLDTFAFAALLGCGYLAVAFLMMILERFQ